MNPNRTANLSIALVFIGWVLCAYAIFSNMGDPAPWVTQEEIDSWRHRSLVIAFFGIIFISVSLFLSGRSFPEAKIRSSIALAAFIAPFTWVFFNGLWQQ